MSEHNSVWDEYIGPSSWRTLLAFESWALRDSRPIDLPGEPLQDVGWPDEEKQHLYVHPISKDSTVIFFAGREFLIGVPPDINTMLDSKRPCNLILLSWESEHIGGLVNYCRDFLEHKPDGVLTIWTSDWIWEHVQSHAVEEKYEHLLMAKRARHLGEPEEEAYPEVQEESEEDEGAGTEAQEKLKINYIAFREHFTEKFAPQVEMSMCYDVGTVHPQLRAQFRLFATRLTVCIDPPKKWDKHSRDWDDLPTTEQYQQKCLLPIYDQFPEAQSILGAVVQRRLRELAAANLLTRDKNSSSAVPEHIFSDPGVHYRYTISKKILQRLSKEGIVVETTNNELCPPQLRNTKEVWKETFVTPQKWNKENVLRRSGHIMLTDGDLPLEPAKPDRLPEKCENGGSKPRIYLAIACGGLSTRSGGQITPVRRVLLGEKKLDEKNRINTSLLGLKVLDFLVDQYELKNGQYRLKEDRIFERTLLLIPSPWTDESVREEMSRLLWEYRHLWQDNPEDAPRILYLRQTVILPRFSELGECGAKYYRQYDDSGFQYSPTGHFNFLCSLFDKIVRSELNEFKDDSLIYFSNYNNLGRNINRKILDLANPLLAQEKNCPIVFELIPLLGEDGKPKDQGSYWIQHGESSRLLKPFYFGIDDPDWEQSLKRTVNESRLNKLYMSTGSFLLHPLRLKHLCGDFQDQEKVQFYARYKPPFVYTRAVIGSWYARSMQNTIQFERDVDQVTWLFDGCQGVAIDEQDGKERFFPIKAEEDLYKDKYEQLRELYADLPETIISPIVPPDYPLSLSPVENFDVWGGDRIRVEKNLPPSEEPVSETWEGSLYHKGVSGVRFNALHDLPLTDLVSEERFDLMAKFLDCNQWLSVQLHPSEWTCTQIKDILKNEQSWGNLTSGLTDSEKEALKAELESREDDEGKEEIFYVIDAPSNRNTLPYYFGLNSGKLAGFSGFEGIVIPNEISKICKMVKENSKCLELEHLIPYDELRLPKGLDKELLKQGYEETKQRYRERFKHLIDSKLGAILELREETTLRVLDGIVLILAIRALRESIKSLPENDGKEEMIIGVFRSANSPLLRFFHQLSRAEPGTVIRVQPGVIHAAGPGLYLVEASNQSNNTFRIFDHGREFSHFPRPTHYTLAAVALSDESFIETETDEQHHVISRWTSELSIGDIRLELLKPEKLTSWYNLKEMEPESGYVLLCTKGRLRLQLAYHLPGKKPKLWREIEVPTAQAGYIQPAPSGYHVAARCKRVAFYESSGVGLRSKRVSGRPALCVTIGGTHFQFTYHAYPKPKRGGREKDIYLWHEILESLEEATWEERRRKLNEKLKAFLDIHHDKNQSIEFLGLSWPGFSKDGKLYSNILQCTECEARNVIDVSVIKNMADTKPRHILFDASADVRAEVLESAGYLREHETGSPRMGMLLNFASGVCMSIYDSEKKQVKETIGGIEIQHMGRLMWFDPVDWKWLFDAHWRSGKAIEQIKKGEYEQLPSDSLTNAIPPERIIRLSEFLSTTAVAFRFLWQIYQSAGFLFEIEPNLEVHLDTCGPLPGNVREIFEESKIQLSAEAESLPEEGYRWMIIDKGKSQAYAVRKENGKLNVYLATDWETVRREIVQNLLSESDLGSDKKKKLEKEAEKKLEECMTKAKEPVDRDKRSQKLGEIIRDYRPLLNAVIRPLFDWIAYTAQSQETSHPDHKRRRKLCRQFIKTIAYDYADMIAFLIRSVSSIEGFEDFRKYASYIVLGAYGGVHFGLCRNMPNDTDIFLDALKQQLRQHGFPIGIQRSQATQFPYRLLDVCRYLDEQRKSDGSEERISP